MKIRKKIDRWLHGGPPEKTPPYGVLAEFVTPHALLHAAGKLRAHGYTCLEAYSPFPVHGLDTVLGSRGSLVPWVVLAGAVFGGASGLALQWWTSAVDYPIRIAGKPFFSLPAFVPVIFELTVLFSAFAALFGMLFLNGLPRPHHPVFFHPRFARASDDRFFLAIESEDPLFDVERARADLAAAGGTAVEVLEG